MIIFDRSVDYLFDYSNFNFINFSLALKYALSGEWWKYFKSGSEAQISHNHRRIGKIISELSNRFEIERTMSHSLINE